MRWPGTRGSSGLRRINGRFNGCLDCMARWSGDLPLRRGSWRCLRASRRREVCRFWMLICAGDRGSGEDGGGGGVAPEHDGAHCRTAGGWEGDGFGQGDVDAVSDRPGASGGVSCGLGDAVGTGRVPIGYSRGERRLAGWASAGWRSLGGFLRNVKVGWESGIDRVIFGKSGFRGFIVEV